MPGQHAFLPPSGADSWMTCSYWPWANAERVDDGDSVWSAEGTAAHKVREACLMHDLDPGHFYGSKITVSGMEFEVDDEMISALQPGIDEIRSYGGRLFVEERVYFDRWLPKGQFGSMDAGIITPEMLILSDLKYGQGIPVSPIWNKQQIIYTAGFWDRFARHRWSGKKVRIIIDQPRHSGGGGFWDTTIDEVLDFMETKAKPAAERVFRKFPQRTASEKGCMFCPESLTCPAYEKFRLDQLKLDFDDIDEMMEDEAQGRPVRLPERSLTAEEKAFLVRNASVITGWIDALHAELLDDALHGRDVPMKAVPGRRPNRYWKDEEAAKRHLLRLLPVRAVVKESIMSPSEAEKALPKRDAVKLKSFWDQGEAKPILVPKDDKRPSVATLVDEFDYYD